MLGTVTIDGVKSMEDKLRKEWNESSDRHSSSKAISLQT